MAYRYPSSRIGQRPVKIPPFSSLILLEDEDILIVNKPAGISSTAERRGEANSMDKLAHKYDHTLRLMHRLDKPTSGILLFAKGKENERVIAAQFARREVIKHYVALVHGRHKWQEYVVEAPLSQNSKGKTRIDPMHGKAAVTVFDTAELFREYSLIDCQPITGRTHQIRVHLSYAKAPIVGDQVYGGPEIYLSELKKKYKTNRSGVEQPIHKGLMLHARGIVFQHPSTEEPVQVISPLRKDMESALRILRKYGS